MAGHDHQCEVATYSRVADAYTVPVSASTVRRDNAPCARFQVATVSVPMRVGAFTRENSVQAWGQVRALLPLPSVASRSHFDSGCARMSFSLSMMSWSQAARSRSRSDQSLSSQAGNQGISAG